MRARSMRDDSQGAPASANQGARRLPGWLVVCLFPVSAIPLLGVVVAAQVFSTEAPRLVNCSAVVTDDEPPRLVVRAQLDDGHLFGRLLTRKRVSGFIQADEEGVWQLDEPAAPYELGPDNRGLRLEVWSKTQFRSKLELPEVMLSETESTRLSP